MFLNLLWVLGVHTQQRYLKCSKCKLLITEPVRGNMVQVTVSRQPVKLLYTPRGRSPGHLLVSEP